MSVEQEFNNEPGREDADNIHVNDYGSSIDSAVMIDEADRSVLLTEDETIVFEKQPRIEIVPSNRPRKVYAGMWGTPEIVAVALGSFAVIVTLLIYFFAVVPSNREIEKTRADGDRLQLELTSANSKYGKITSTETQVSTLLSSVNDFELSYLHPAASGKNVLYQRINGLIQAYGLTNTTGPDYTPLEAPDQDSGKQSEEERGRAKFRSIFPGIYVTMTLDGSYQNLRRFINDLERSNDFVVVSAIELEPSDSETQKATPIQENQPGPVRQPIPGNPPGFGGVSPNRSGVQPQSAAPKGKTHGETVSLRLELAAYFRRQDFVPMETMPAKTTGNGGTE